MSKVIEATCENELVTAEGVVVESAEILSEGVAASEGVLVMDKEKTYYLAKTSPDLKSTLEKLISTLTQIASALTAIDAKPTGGSGSAPVPAATGNVSSINTLKSELTALKDGLK